MSIRAGPNGEAIPLVGEEPGAIVGKPTPPPYQEWDSKDLRGIRIYDTHHGVKRHVPLVESSKTDIHRAVEASDPARLADLLETELKAKIDHQNCEGFTALHYACMMSTYGANFGRADPDRIACAKLLIDAGADLNVRGQWGHTALHEAALSHYPAVEVTKYLVDAGADLLVLDDYGGTAVHCASQVSHCAQLKELMKHADFDKAKAIVNKEGNTAISIAVDVYEKNEKKVQLAPVFCEVRMLLETGKGFESGEEALAKAQKAKEKAEKKKKGAA
jgi:hypothetical protein